MFKLQISCSEITCSEIKSVKNMMLMGFGGNNRGLCELSRGTYSSNWGLCPIISSFVTDSEKDFDSGWSIRLCHSCAIESPTPVSQFVGHTFRCSLWVVVSVDQNFVGPKLTRIMHPQSFASLFFPRLKKVKLVCLENAPTLLFDSRSVWTVTTLSVSNISHINCVFCWIFYVCTILDSVFDSRGLLSALALYIGLLSPRVSHMNILIVFSFEFLVFLVFVLS